MNKILKEKEIKRWWDSKRQLRWKNIYEGKDYSSLALNNREFKILDYLSKNNKKLNILEIGFGGGQLAYKILKEGHIYTGIDVSSNLTKIANAKCKKYQKKKYNFSVGSFNKRLKFKNNCFDLVIMAGVLQYSSNPKFVFSEINRVLKEKGEFICAQTNIFKLHFFFKFRTLLIRFYYFLSKEKYAINDSLRSFFLETKLKKYVNKSFKKFVINNKYCNKGYSVNKFDFKKRIFFRKKLIDLGKQNNFTVITKDACGPYLQIGYKFSIYAILNYILEIFSNIFFFKFLKKFGESQIIIFKK